MPGLTQRHRLLISSLVRHAAGHRSRSEVVSNLGGPTYHRTTYAEVERRSRRLARPLAKLGVGFGDRVATLAWNGRGLPLARVRRKHGALRYISGTTGRPKGVLYSQRATMPA
jgi:fatty-acyl-CoA synthase